MATHFTLRVWILRQTAVLVGIGVALALAPTPAGAGPCEAELNQCTNQLGTCIADLTTCAGDLATCDGDLTTCTGDLATCADELALCEATQRSLPGDGWDEAVPPGGHGAALAYQDCGDGTIADLNTGLLWEKKTTDGSIHDVDNMYTWSSRGMPDWGPHGTVFTVFLPTLNSAGGFAGYSDWRLPNVKELQSIVDYSVFFPSIHPDFGPTLPQQLPVPPSKYWSATPASPDCYSCAWTVNFFRGDVLREVKYLEGYVRVRAVRNGSCP